MSLSETEVVVGGDVQATGATTGGIEVSVVIISVTSVTNDRSAWDSGDRGREAIVEPEFESLGIERIEI